MEITLLSVLDEEEITHEKHLYYKLRELKKYENHSDFKLKYMSKVFTSMHSPNISISFIAQLNSLAKYDVIFIKGDKYNYKFSFSEFVKYSEDNNDFEDFNIIEDSTVLEFGSIFVKRLNKRIDFISDADLKTWVYKLLLLHRKYKVYKEYIHNTNKSNLPIKHKPIIDHPYFGNGELSDLYTSINFGIYKSKTPIKDLLDRKLETAEYVFKEEKIKRDLVDLLFFKVKGYKPKNDVDEEQRIYRMYRNKGIKYLKGEKTFETDKQLVDYGFEYGELFRRATNILEGDDMKINRDLFNKTTSIIKDLFTLTDIDLMNKFVNETIRVIFPVIKKIFSKKDKLKDKPNLDLELMLLKDIFIVGILHYIYNSGNYNFILKGTTSKREYDLFRVFTDYIKKRNKNTIKTLNLSDTDIEKLYYKKAIYTSTLVHTNNVLNAQKFSQTIVDYFEVYTIETQMLIDAKRNNGLLKDLYKNKYSLDVEKGIDLNYDKFRDFIENGVTGTPFLATFLTAPAITVLRKGKKSYYRRTSKFISDFSDYSIDRFYKYYKYGCPKSTYHEFVNNACKYCKVTEKELKDQDKGYYNRYKTNFEVLDISRNAVIFELKKSSPEETKNVIQKDVISKINDTGFKFKLNKNKLENLSKTENVTELHWGNGLIDSKINKDQIHKMKTYALKLGIKLNILNNNRTNEELYYILYNMILKIAKKEDMVKIIDKEKGFLFMDVSKEIKKRGIVLEKDGEEDFTFDLDDDSAALLEHEEIIDENDIEDFDGVGEGYIDFN